MDKKRFIKKVSFDISVCSTVLLGGIVLSNNYKLSPETVFLTGTCIASSVVFVKTKRNCKRGGMNE